MFKSFLYLVASLLTVCCYGQDIQLEKHLDMLLAEHFKLTEPGCEVLVARKGQIIYKKAFGSADIELNVPVSADMVFNLASITKQFTAVAILQLVEQGKMRLQDSLQKFIPDFPSKRQTITIEHLLTHTSGIPDYMQINYPNLYMERWDFTPKQLIDSFKNYPLEFEPGTKYSYSNSGYYLLGYIIEKVSQKTYPSYLQDNILTPLALHQTYFDSAGIIIPNRVKGYWKESTGYKNADFWSPTIAYSAGGLLSNTEDLFKWFKGLSEYKILKKETLEKAFTPFKLKNGSPVNYGYGWYIENSNNVRSIEHSGKMSGFTSNEIYYPQQDVYIAILINCENAPRDEISQGISEIVLGQSLQTEIKLSQAILNSYVGTYYLTTDPKRTIVVSIENNHLLAKVSGQQEFEMLFETSKVFQFKNVKSMTGEFISDNGVVTKIIVEQNGHFEWKKVK